MSGEGRHPFWEERWYDDQHCCEAHAKADAGGWGLGSHYHCSSCWAETSMLGHHTSIHVVGGKPVKVKSHRCCPGNCELEPAPSPLPPSSEYTP